MYIIFYDSDNVSYAINGIIETFVKKVIDMDAVVSYDAIKHWVKIDLPLGTIISRENIEMLSALLKAYDYEVYTELVVD